MRRWKIIFCACMAVLLTTLSLAWAAQEYKTQVKLSGTRLSVQHLVEGKGQIKESAVLLDKNNKIAARWKQRTTNKWYKDYQDGWKYFRYVPYTMDMKNLPAGKYRFVTTTTLANKQTFKETRKISFKPKLVMQYSKTKIVRNENGDIWQRLYFKKKASAGKMCYAQIFDKNNKLVHSVKYKAKNANEDFAFSWNGWGRGSSAKKCPKGMYTVKYWMDGMNPKTAKFRLSI